MPIFEYLCVECGHKFEAIVFGDNKTECPKCHAAKLEPQLSTFAAHSRSSAAPSPCGQAACCMNNGGGCSMN